MIGPIYTATFALGSGWRPRRARCSARVRGQPDHGRPCDASRPSPSSSWAGLGSILGATIGGFILAFVEELGAGYISSGYRDAMGFLLIIVILLLKPTGLFAAKERVG